jgi:hypothetical protein
MATETRCPVVHGTTNVGMRSNSDWWPKELNLTERGKSHREDGAKAFDPGGAAVYATRKFIVEPVFGQIKQARGFRQFLLRGIEKVRGEWALICMTHNILKFHKICSG